MFESPDDVDPIVDHADPRVMEAAGKRRARAPSIGRRTVLLDGRRDEGETLLESADHVNLAAHGGGSHLGALSRGRRLRDPLSFGLSECEGGERDGN